MRFTLFYDNGPLLLLYPEEKREWSTYDSAVEINVQRLYCDTDILTKKGVVLKSTI